ncbi:hypothetical protein AB0K35_25670 [Micromonospora sp. NPDC053740]|uniref:hypothetical protein n=1 Tax=Micromonospora sp. NPDC053740 TaxID=3155173 RepID=UPI00341E8CCA
MSSSVPINTGSGTNQQNYDEYDGYYSGIGLAWAAKANYLNLTRGWANATVTWGSFTITANGWLCYSYSPTTSTTITSAEATRGAGRATPGPASAFARPLPLPPAVAP